MPDTTDRPWVDVPSRHLPTPPVRPLPEPVSLRRMLGPSIILAGLGVGSGEFVLWPHLTATWGFTLFWACLIGVGVQFLLNMEIERYTLATGESVVTGFARLDPLFGPVFFLCATVPWVWPGWATGGATLLTWELGIAAERIPWIASGGLVLCGAILSLGPVVYRTVESIQLVLVLLIFVIVLALAAWVVDSASWSALGEGLANSTIPEGVAWPTLLGALAFAGAGGAMNLAQSNYIKDKGYGMGRWVGRITSPWTGREEADAQIGFTPEGGELDEARWRVWWRRANLEHFVSFFLLCAVSLVLFCLLAHTLLRDVSGFGEGLGFIREEGRQLEERFGAFGRHAFLGAGILVLFSTELALLDGVSRVAADTMKLSVCRDRGPGLSKLYYATLWSLIGFGILVLFCGFDQPLTLLVLSACLNGFVMFLYSGLLLWTNRRSFHGPLRPRVWRLWAMGFATLFFGYFSALTVWDRVFGS